MAAARKSFRWPSSSARTVIYAVGEVVRFPHVGNQLEVPDALSERHLKLLGIDHAREGVASPLLSTSRLDQQVGVPGE